MTDEDKKTAALEKQFEKAVKERKVIPLDTTKPNGDIANKYTNFALVFNSKQNRYTVTVNEKKYPKGLVELGKFDRDFFARNMILKATEELYNLTFTGMRSYEAYNDIPINSVEDIKVALQCDDNVAYIIGAIARGSLKSNEWQGKSVAIGEPFLIQNRETLEFLPPNSNGTVTSVSAEKLASIALNALKTVNDGKYITSVDGIEFKNSLEKFIASERIRKGKNMKNKTQNVKEEVPSLFETSNTVSPQQSPQSSNVELAEQQRKERVKERVKSLMSGRDGIITRDDYSPLLKIEKEELLEHGFEQDIADNMYKMSYDHMKSVWDNKSLDLIDQQNAMQEEIHAAKMRIARKYVEGMIPEEIREEIDEKQDALSRESGFLPPHDYEEQWEAASKKGDYETLYGLAYRLEDANYHTELKALYAKEYDVIKARQAQQNVEAERLYEKTATKQTIQSFSSLRYDNPHYEQQKQQINAAEEYIRSHGYEPEGFRETYIIFNGKEGAIIVPNVSFVRKHGFIEQNDDGFAMWKFSIDNPKGIEPFNDKQYKTTQDGGILCKNFIEAQHIASEILPLKEIVRPLSFNNTGADTQDLDSYEQHEVKELLPRNDPNNEYIAEHTTRAEYNRLMEERDRHDLPPEVTDIITYEILDTIKERIERERDRLTNVSESKTINQGERNESKEPRAVQGSKSEDYSQGRRGRDNTTDVQERQGRTDSQVGGADGRGYSGDGYGDDISGRTAPSNDTVPSGRVSVSGDDDRTGGTGIREGRLPQGGMEGQLQESVGGVQQPLDGHGLDSLSNKTQKIAYATFRITHPQWTKQLDDAEKYIKSLGCQIPAEVMLKGNVGAIIATTEDATGHKIWGFSLDNSVGIAPLPIGKDGSPFVGFYSNRSDASIEDAERLAETILASNTKIQEREVTSTHTRGEIAIIREQCREILKKDDSDITDADKTILSQYEGGGGIKQEKDRSVDAVLNEFYTPRNVINKVWELVNYYVPDAQTVLEPTSGIGRFAEGNNQKDKKFTLREIDATSARIAHLLHPKAEVIQEAFQAQFFDENGIARKKDFILPKYDIVIGNPPYGEYKNEWKGKGEGAEHTRQEEYFIDKGIDSLNDNGILAFVVPSGFMRNTSNAKLKERLGERAELIDAWRLPNGTFGTTDVGTDIIVMRRHLDTKDMAQGYADMMKDDKFFKENPDHILGEEKTRMGRFGEEKYVALHEGMTTDEELSHIPPSNTSMPLYANDIQSVPLETERKELSYVEKVAAWEPAQNTLLADPNVASGKFFPLHKAIDHEYRHVINTDYSSIRNGWNLNIYLDAASGDSILMYNSTLLAYADHNGIVTSDWTNADVSKARKDTVNDSTNKYREIAALLAHSYIGCTYETRVADNVTMARLWLRDTSANNTSGMLQNIRVIDRENNMSCNLDGRSPTVCSAIGIETMARRSPKFIVHESKMQEDADATWLTTDKPKYKQPNNVFYALPQYLYPSDGSKPNFNSICDSDLRIRRKWTEKVRAFKMPPENETHLYDEKWYEDLRKQRLAEAERGKIPLEELLSESGMTLAECERFARTAVERDIEALKEKRAFDKDMLQFEKDGKRFFDAIINAPTWKTGAKIQTHLGKVTIMDEPKDPGTYSFYLNDNKILSINEGRKELKTYNNFRITKAFYDDVKTRYAVNDLTVKDEVWRYRKVSLADALAKKSIDEKKTQTGAALALAVLSSDGYEKKGDNDLPIKTVIENGIEITAVQDGTYLRATLKGDNYSAFEVDTRSKALFIYQAAFDNGIWQGIENGVKETWKDVDVTKEVKLNGINYFDHNGETVTMNQTYKQYKPEKEKLQNTDAFMSLYGKKWDTNDKVFWEVTNWSGHIDTGRLSKKQFETLRASKNYVEDTPGHYIHKELFISGNIYEKLEMLEREHVNGTFDTDEKLYENNKQILLSAIPKRLTAAEINIPVTTDFAHDSAYGKPLTEQFIEWATGMNIIESPNKRNNISDWTFASISQDDIPNTISWGDVVACIDRLPIPRINNNLDPEEKSRMRQQITNDRRETAEKLFTRFTQTILQGEEKERFEERWNRTYNAFHIPDYSKLPLFIDGMNLYRKGRDFKLYDQQIKGVSFLCNKGNGLLAYDVGVGKTACGVVTAVAQIQSGRAIRPLIIVPQQVLGKWESDIHELFPRIRVNNLGNFNGASLGAFYDGGHGLNIPSRSITVASKEALNNIVFEKSTIDNYLYDDFANMLNLTEDCKSEDDKTRVDAEQEIYEKAGMANKTRSDNYIYWERTGFDSVIVDEAHAYKNLIRIPRPSATTRKEKARKQKKKQAALNTIDDDDEAQVEKENLANEFAGLGGGVPAARALKMFAITQLVQRENNGRNVFMLTATPFTNSPLEIYSMLMYVARSEMEKQGIRNAYSFCTEYAKTRLEIAVAPNGTVTQKNVMKEFNNPHGLQRILLQYIDKVDAEEAGVIRPDRRIHKVYLEPTKLQKEIFEFASDVVMTGTNTRKDKNGEEKGEAPMLRGISIMRLASVSPALLSEDMLLNPETGKPSGIMIPPLSEIVDCSPKLKLVCDTVASNWKKRPDCGQVIYLPVGTEAYNHVIDYLARQGVSRNAIATIDGQKATVGGKAPKDRVYRLEKQLLPHLMTQKIHAR